MNENLNNDEQIAVDVLGLLSSLTKEEEEKEEIKFIHVFIIKPI